MEVFLLRHGIAIDHEDPDCPPEADRFLTDKGRKRTEESVRGLWRAGAVFESIWTSPYVRARQTAEIAAEQAGLELGEIRVHDALLPDRAPELMMALLHQQDANTILCCGHAPHLDRLLAYALGAPRPFTQLKKAGAAWLSITKESSTLLAVYPARILRQLS